LLERQVICRRLDVGTGGTDDIGRAASPWTAYRPTADPPAPGPKRVVLSVQPTPDGRKTATATAVAVGQSQSRQPGTWPATVGPT